MVTNTRVADYHVGELDSFEQDANVGELLEGETRDGRPALAVMGENGVRPVYTSNIEESADFCYPRSFR